MKKLIHVFLLASAITTSAFAVNNGGGTVGSDREFVIDGVRAEDLIEAAGRLNLDDYNMVGKSDLDLHDVICKKMMPTQGGYDGKIECLIGLSSTAYTPETGSETNILVTTNKKDQKDAVIRFRSILSELTGAEIQINSTEIRMKVKSISCHAINHSFDLEGLMINGGGSCKITL